jgi:spore maturation protein CgeB
MKKSELTKLIKEAYKEVLTEGIENTPIHKFVYFGYNYPNNWIEKVWEGNAHMIEHLSKKFRQAYEKYGSKAAMNYFYVELDSVNQNILEKWIIKNYKG